MRTPRRRSREFAMQAIYQSFLNPDYSISNIFDNIVNTDAFIHAVDNDKIKLDKNLFTDIVNGVLSNKEFYLNLMRDLFDRKEKEINIVEKSILLIACHELKNMPNTPHIVIINEAIELAKLYGATDGYKFINGILDKLSVKLRNN